MTIAPHTILSGLHRSIKRTERQESCFKAQPREVSPTRARTIKSSKAFRVKWCELFFISSFFFIQPSTRFDSTRINSHFTSAPKNYMWKYVFSCEISPGGNDNITKQYQESGLARWAECLEVAILELNYLSLNVFGYLFMHFMCGNELLR